MSDQQDPNLPDGKDGRQAVSDQAVSDQAPAEALPPAVAEALPLTPSPTGRGRATEAEYLAGWKRALADYENLQKSNAQMREEDRRRLRVQLADDLLPVIDNFGYVLKHVPSLDGCSEDFKKQFDTWFAGIGHIDRQFAEALRGLGVEPIATVGQPFDPNLHESSGTRADSAQASGVILEELVRGWKLGDLTLRPAKVIVNELTP